MINNKLTEDVLKNIIETDHVQCGEASALARIVLAAQSARPVYQWRELYEEGSLWDDCTKSQYDGFAKKADCEVRTLYTAPVVTEDGDHE